MKGTAVWVLTVVMCAGRVSHAADAPLVGTAASPGAFRLVENKAAADVFVDGDDYKVVQIAAELLSGDVERVTGVKPGVHHSNDKPHDLAKQTVFVGTLGHSPALDAIIKDKKIDVTAIQGKWESYLITTVSQPMAGVENGLMIIGSDRRGTAYGVFGLSEEMGVSPWYWWADVPATHRENLFVAGGLHVQGPPSVKYRGIFLNDEDWGLQPWAAKTFEPKSAGGTGDVGPKTYAKVFELLLRLKANFCWPAMHEVTQAFNIYPENKRVADDYAIVMGSSHCEPMLRNNVTEWGQANAATYNYVTNRQGVLDYWRKRVEENGKFENVYTLGMRGIHDSDMAGGGTSDQRAQRLNGIVADQRAMIHDLLNAEVAKVPQIFCPYKEVLTLYQHGAVPPEDVTLVWADDNHGYIRQFSTPAEQKRSGGAGVYYHVSYYGAPYSYLWLCTIPPALVWEELSKAYDYGSRTLWVVNVGDLKPAEIDMTLAMNMASDIGRYGLENIAEFLQDFAARTFGAERAGEIAAVLREYYRLNYQRKPEHMGFNTSDTPTDPIKAMPFSDQEIQERLAAFAALRGKTDALYATIPVAQKDAFYELVVYPVRGSALQNQKLLYAEINRRAAEAGDTAGADAAAARSKAAYEQIQKETAYYNETLAGGKWKGMMSASPRDLAVFKLPKFAQAGPSASASTQPAGGMPSSVTTAIAGGAPNAFLESGGCVSLAAEHFTRRIDRGNGGWKVIPDLGRLGDSVAVYPTTTPSVTEVKAMPTASPELQYDFVSQTADAAAKIVVQAIPTHRINPERGLRYAVAVDNETPQIVDLETPENDRTWAANVLRAAALGTTTHNIPAGRHILHIFMVDPGVVLDHVTIDLGGLKPSYLPPAETRRVSAANR